MHFFLRHCHRQPAQDRSRNSIRPFIHQPSSTWSSGCCGSAGPAATQAQDAGGAWASPAGGANRC